MVVVRVVIRLLLLEVGVRVLLLWWWWWWWCCSGGGGGGSGGVTGGGGSGGNNEGCDGAVVIRGRDGSVVKVVVVVALLLFGTQFIHGTYKLPQKTMRVHIARCTQCIHVRSHELKLPKICIPIKYIIAPLSTHTHTTQKVQI